MAPSSVLFRNGPSGGVRWQSEQSSTFPGKRCDRVVNHVDADVERDDVGVQAAFSLMNQHVLLDGTHAAGRTLTRDELGREIARMFVAYVGITQANQWKEKGAKP